MHNVFWEYIPHFDRSKVEEIRWVLSAQLVVVLFTNMILRSNVFGYHTIAVGGQVFEKQYHIILSTSFNQGWLVYLVSLVVLNSPNSKIHPHVL